MSISPDTLIEYALDTLEPDQKAQVSQALADSPALALELAAWQRCLAAFAQVLPPLTPRPHVQDKLLSALEPPVQPIQAAPHTMQAAPHPMQAVPRPMRRSAPRPMNRVNRFLQVGLSSAALLAAVFFAWRTGELQSQLEKLELQVLGRSQTLAQSRPVALLTSNKNPIGQAFVATDGTVLIALRLPAPPSGKTYQAWFITPNNPPQPLQTLEQNLDSKIPTSSVAIAISLEPVGGSKTPSQVLGVGEVKF